MDLRHENLKLTDDELRLLRFGLEEMHYDFLHYPGVYFGFDAEREGQYTARHDQLMILLENLLTYADGELDNCFFDFNGGEEL